MAIWNVRFKNQLDQQINVKLRKQTFDRPAIARQYRAMLQTLRDGYQLPQQSQSFIFPKQTRTKMTRWQRPASTILERRRTAPKIPKKTNEMPARQSPGLQGALFTTGLNEQFTSSLNQSRAKSLRYAAYEQSRVSRPLTSCSVSKPVDMVERLKHRPRLSYSRLLSQGLMVPKRLLKQL